jgi:putative FmdB family regulatory protein
MPVYEYECKQCGHRHEIMQRLADAPLTVCADCKGEVYRVISPSGISFKGEGWYITDYARKGQDKDGKKTVDKDAKTDVKSDAPPPVAKGEKKEAVPSVAPAGHGAPPPPPSTSSGPSSEKKN